MQQELPLLLYKNVSQGCELLPQGFSALFVCLCVCVFVCVFVCVCVCVCVTEQQGRGKWVRKLDTEKFTFNLQDTYGGLLSMASHQ